MKTNQTLFETYADWVSQCSPFQALGVVVLTSLLVILCWHSIGFLRSRIQRSRKPIERSRLINAAGLLDGEDKYGRSSLSTRSLTSFEKLVRSD